MHWYIAKLIFQVVDGEVRQQAQFDEQLRLIKAANDQQAFNKANHLGIQNAEKLSNSGNQSVTWQFINVAELNPLENLTDGAEIYYQIHETTEADMYIAYTNHKAALLQLQY